MTSEDEQFVPKANHDQLIEELREIKEAVAKVVEERNQLREALSKVQAGIHKASENHVYGFAADAGELHIKIDSWRKAREIAMDLMHIKNDNTPIMIEYHGGILTSIKEKKIAE